MSGAVGSTPRYTRSGLPVFTACSSFAFNSSSRIISATPFFRYASCSSTGLNFADDTIFSPTLSAYSATRAALPSDTAPPAQSAPLPYRCDVPRAISAPPDFPAYPHPQSPRTPAAQSAPHPDFHPRSAPCSRKTSRHAPAPAAAIPVPETPAAAKGEYSRSAAETPRRNAAKAAAYIPPGTPAPLSFPAAPPPPACRKPRAPIPSTESPAPQSRGAAPSRSLQRLRDCSPQSQFPRPECAPPRRSPPAPRNSIRAPIAARQSVSSSPPEISTVPQSGKTSPQPSLDSSATPRHRVLRTAANLSRRLPMPRTRPVLLAAIL